MSEAKVRLHWIDSLRGLAVALVVIYHANGIPRIAIESHPSLGPVWDAVTGAIAPLCIPLLLILSGLFLHRALAKPLLAHVGGLLRMVWPFLLWSSLTMLAAGSSPLDGTFWGWVGGPYHMWYLAVLLIC